jgi:hypothetical protein
MLVCSFSLKNVDQVCQSTPFDVGIFLQYEPNAAAVLLVTYSSSMWKQHKQAM